MVWGMVFKGGKWVSKLAAKKGSAAVKKLRKKIKKGQFKETRGGRNNPKGTNQWSKVTKSGKPPKRQTTRKDKQSFYKKVQKESAAKRKEAKKTPAQQAYYDRVQKDPYVSIFAKKKRKPKKKK